MVICKKVHILNEIIDQSKATFDYRINTTLQ